MTRRFSALALLFFAVTVGQVSNLPLMSGSLAASSRKSTVNPQTLGEPQRQDPEQARAEFKAAGVCARCHVISVLEWGISGHFTADTGTDCKSCHGPSAGHVANERNEVKPDRLPREAQIAKTCMGCHDAGCPKTLDAASCQKCHHVHALVNRAERRSVADERLVKLLDRWEKFRHQMDEGDRLVQLRKWEAARGAFRAALDLIPGNHRAAARLAMCERRLEPELPGFEIVGADFDAATGLPREVNVPELGIAMVLVPAGEFDMGDDSISDARPVHTVAVEPFYLGKFELTQADWKAVMGTNPSIHQGPDFADRERMPVEYVSWDECQALVRKLNERMPGGGFRLPTEAEWEYACRTASPRPGVVGQASSLPMDPTVLMRFAWFRDNSARQPDARAASQQADAWAPRPVGMKQPNRWGLYDMQGNVREWCSTLHRPYLYDRNDGRESLTAPGLRVLRGGGYADSAESLDPAARHAERPQRRFRWNGLRLARSVPK